MKRIKTLPGFGNRNKRPALLTVAAMLAFTAQLQAQNSSYNLNSIPVGGSNNCAFGSGVLLSTTGVQNSAIGYQVLTANTNGRDNAAIGFKALFTNKTGSYNAAGGSYALHFNESGFYNAAFGYQALYGNLASNNTAMGFRSMYFNTTGNDNTANGYAALYSNSTGRENVASGYQAMYGNTTGGGNVAIGSIALYTNTTGNNNTAAGYRALYTNTAGEGNTGIGFDALYANTTGLSNSALGFRSLPFNTTGNDNLACGLYSMYGNITGSNNAATGNFALATSTAGDGNVANGYYALYTNTTGSQNTGVGSYADVSTGNLSNATALGNSAVVNAGNKVRIGNAAVTVIEGQVAYSWPSDGRFKTNIKEDDVKGLEFIKKLRPVVYNFDTRKLTEFQTKHMPDSIRQHYLSQDFAASTRIRQSGFIAQEVEKAAKEVNYDFNAVHAPEHEDDNYSLAYAEFVVPLVKGMQEQQKMIETQQQQIQKLQQQVNELLNARGTGIAQNQMEGASMDQNVPNPFSHETVVEFSLPAQVVSAAMTIYDLSGKQLRTIPITQRGAASVTISADQLPAGMYLYSIIADGRTVGTKRMVIADK